MKTRPATREDAPTIAHIYNQGIEERIATFETEPRSAGEVLAWFDKPYPVIVVEEDGKVIAFVSASEYRPRVCYAGVAEFSVYVTREQRGLGTGRLAMEALIEALEGAGFWKLLSRVFPENASSRRLLKSLGFREVGTYKMHGQLEGVWKDVTIVERLITENLLSRRTSSETKPTVRLRLRVCLGSREGHHGRTANDIPEAVKFGRLYIAGT